MIYSHITFKAKADKVDAIKELYQGHFKELRDANVRIKHYEVYTAKDDETRFFTIKTFETRADERDHHTDPELMTFVKALGALCEVTADFHEVELFAAK